MRYLDFHTHRKQKKENDHPGKIKAIYSLDLLSPTPIDTLEYFSVGLHPWHISNKTADSLLLQLEHIAENPHCLSYWRNGN